MGDVGGSGLREVAEELVGVRPVAFGLGDAEEFYEVHPVNTSNDYVEVRIPTSNQLAACSWQRRRTKAEAQFLAIGEGVHAWLVEAAATGATRVRAKTPPGYGPRFARAVDFATIMGTEKVDRALGLAAGAAGSTNTTWVRSLTTCPPTLIPGI